MLDGNCCCKDGCVYPITNKTHRLCKIHSWERNHKGQDYFEYHQNKKVQYVKKMQERVVSKVAENPPKPYIWKSKKEPKPIKPVSDKMSVMLEVYSKKRKVYLSENPQCEAHFCNCATSEEELTIHHKMGRVGYASDMKRELEIPLLIDEDYFLAVCGVAHRWIEDNVEKAKEWGYSVGRNTVAENEAC